MKKLYLPTAGEAAGSPRQRRRNGERGQSVIELALTLPILMILLLGLIEFGHAYNSYLTVLASARDAARLAAQGGASGATLRNLIDIETTRLPDANDLDANNDCAAPSGGVCIRGINVSTGEGDGLCTVDAPGAAVLQQHRG